MNRAFFILAGLGLVLFAAGGATDGGTDAGNGGNGDRPPVGPIPTPQTEDDVAMIRNTICQCAAQLGPSARAAEILACTLQAIHPDVPWPAIPGYDDESVVAVEAYLLAQVQAFLAAPSPQQFCEEPDTIVEVLTELLSPVGDPMPGRFYQIQKGDNLATIARKALNSVIPGSGSDGGDGKGGQRRLEYIRCVTSGPGWNSKLYASPSFSNTFPSYYGINGIGLRRAFFPWHANAVNAILQGRLPQRAITASGDRLAGRGSEYGLLWLPPVDPDALDRFGTVTCGHVEWADGSSSIDPPPELMLRLAA